MSSQRPNVGYFCMEYGLKTELKTYSGGLGILAGDFMKGVSDGDYPMVGIGLKWKQGYVTQTLGDEGQIIDAFPNADFPDLEDTGIKVTVTVGGKDVVARHGTAKALAVHGFTHAVGHIKRAGVVAVHKVKMSPIGNASKQGMCTTIRLGLPNRIPTHLWHFETTAVRL